MHIKVTGKNDRLSRSEIKEAVNIFGEITLGKRLAKNVSVVVENKKMNRVFMGFCNPVSEERNPREFHIVLNSLISKNDQLRTIAHEMVHVQQFARNRLKCLDNGKFKWNSKVFRLTDSNYLKVQWEKEAHMCEEYLLKFYKEQKGL